MEWSCQFANIRWAFNKHRMQLKRAETASTRINEPQSKLESDASCDFPIKALLLCVYSIHVATVEVPALGVNCNKDIYVKGK